MRPKSRLTKDIPTPKGQPKLHKTLLQTPKPKKTKLDWRFSLVVKHSPNMGKALGSILSSNKVNGWHMWTAAAMLVGTILA